MPANSMTNVMAVVEIVSVWLCRGWSLVSDHVPMMPQMLAQTIDDDELRPDQKFNFGFEELGDVADMNVLYVFLGVLVFWPIWSWVFSLICKVIDKEAPEFIHAMLIIMVTFVLDFGVFKGLQFVVERYGLGARFSESQTELLSLILMAVLIVVVNTIIYRKMLPTKWLRAIVICVVQWVLIFAIIEIVSLAMGKGLRILPMVQDAIANARA